MKKTISIVACVTVLCVALSLGAFAAGSSYTKNLLANYVGIQLVVDGVTVIPKDANGNVVEPFIVDGTTYLPVRAIAEALGKEVGWDGTTKTVYIGKKPTENVDPAVVGSVGLEYELTSKGTYTVTGIGTCTDAHVVIPEVYQDKAVTGIEARAFYNCSTIKEITIPASVTSIGTQIFFKADSLHTVYYNSTYSSTDNPFLNQKSITKVVFGGKSVPNNICRDMSNIEEVVILDGVTSIGNYAFKTCSGLTTITIADSVTKIGDDAFRSCSSLTSITIPDSVTSIGNYAFRYCSSLTNLTIPGSVTTIGDYHLSSCTSLTSVTISHGVTEIGGSAFYDCDGLTSVTIPDSVTSIGGYAFYGCTDLTHLTIPSSVTTIGNHAFSSCDGLTSITYDGTIAQWETIKTGRHFNDTVLIHCTDGDIEIQV